MIPPASVGVELPLRHLRHRAKFDIARDDKLMAIALGGALRQLLVIGQIDASTQATTARGLETISHDARSDLARCAVV